MSEIVVIDCGMGNLHSVLSGIQRVAPDTAVRVADTPDAIAAAEKVILPGDGHFGACMNAIDSRGLREPLRRAAAEKPFLGICVGMQVLFADSEEADGIAGLGIFPGQIHRLSPADGRRVPHMGWNDTRHERSHPLTDDIADGERFYFIHSYYVPLGDWTLMRVHYGVDISAVIGDGRVLATQFHPEKSGQNGIQLLRRFIEAA